MGLIQPDLGSHKSSQGPVVTQAGHHTFFSLSSRSFYRPQILTFTLTEGFCRGEITQVRRRQGLVAFPQHHMSVALCHCVWNNGLPFSVTVLYSTPTLSLLGGRLISAGLMLSFLLSQYHICHTAEHAPFGESG